ncbi:hypothetical protein [Pseudarthrobacter polychromogenes]|uniref:Uncharacterized protein n=1 Tax=Pseudarthrobacter polychromogenes TaxID=1676 RepID=A0ABQ1X950_9MICC|nr:hypothetical protein [Pseudarthrobacter polychromogenes]GGG83539.1 hypothetical protein GCM10011577_01220 [Pseudarthrobacter polychromogenes]
MQTLENGIKVPTNSDDYDLTNDLAEMGDTTNVIVLVSGQTQRDGLTKYSGLTVRRLDLAGCPTEVWDGAKWHRSPVIASTELVEDGFWDINGGLMRTVTDGFTQVTASFQMTRTGPDIPVTTGDSVIIIGAIPAGFRPPSNASFIAVVHSNTGSLYAQPQLILNSGGSIVARSTSGGPITLGTGYTVFVSISWTI